MKRSINLYENRRITVSELEVEPLGISVVQKLLSKRRLFDSIECANCIFRGSRYCWNQRPYNIWNGEPF